MPRILCGVFIDLALSGIHVLREDSTGVLLDTHRSTAVPADGSGTQQL